MSATKKKRKTARKSKRFTVEAGRQVYLNGQPFISVGREGETRPVDADATTHLIADCLNNSPRRIAGIMKRYGGHGVTHFRKACTCAVGTVCPIHDPRG